MKTMLERVRKVFEDSGLSQTELAKRMDVTPQYIWKIMKKDSEVSDRMLLAIIKAFPDINEEWLKTGEGDMIRPRTRESEIADIVNQMLNTGDDDIRFRITKILYSLTPVQLESLAELGREIFTADEKNSLL